MQIRCLSLLAASCLALGGCAPRAAAPALQLRKVEPYSFPMPQTDASLLASAEVPASAVGYVLRDPDTGSVLREHNADRVFIPASVTKLVTGIAALEVLGADHTFQTELLFRGTLKEGVLDGDLFLRGGGDPFLPLPQLQSLAAGLAQAGVRKVTGGFFFDESRFPAQSCIDPRQEPESTFNPPLSALSLENNLFTATWRPKQEDASAVEAFAVPPVDGLGFALAPSTFPLGAKVKLSTEAPELYLLSPAAGSTGSVKLPLRRPAHHVAALFRRFARGRGIELPIPTPAAAPADAVVLYALRSLPLFELAQQMLSTSDNLMAELFCLATALRLQGKAGSLSDASHAVLAWWQKTLPNVDWSAIRLENGSGLNEDNRLSPRAVQAIFDYASRKTYQGRTVASLLAGAGWKGTLSSRLNTPETSGFVWAKTGTMDYAVAVAGELTTLSGKRRQFTLFVSDAEVRRAAEVRRRSGANASDLEDEAQEWNGAARALADSLLRSWSAEP